MKNFALFLFILFALTNCNTNNQDMISGIIPEPLEIDFQPGKFSVENGMNIVAENNNSDLDNSIELFISEIQSLSSLELKYSEKTKKTQNISITLDEQLNIPEEGYILSISPRKIRINASGNPGVHYALQSLKQMIILHNNGQKKIKLPCVLINDEPRFSWRGMHLDVCRHFIPVEDVKKYIDYLSFYKFNKFHWHLTEDQGWRIEIKQYPLLTEIGAWRDETLAGHLGNKELTYDGIPHGGYYSQEEIREIVDYASQRYIEIIPEIEMPGHARAAIAAYPWLGVKNEEIEVMKEWGISPYIYSPSEQTFEFLENVLDEVIELFPSDYIHIGGDEAIKTQWEESPEIQDQIRKLGLKNEHELQSWFIHRIEKYLNSKSRKIIGWDEILEGGLAPNATVMSWRGEAGGITAAKMGHNVIMSPTSHCYFDYYQAKPEDNEPLAIGGYLPLEKVYSYDPVPDTLTEKESRYILGAQANVWTEYIPDFHQLEYMIFPRMLAMSEVTWTAAGKKNKDAFFERVNLQEKIFNTFGANYSASGMPK